MGVFDRVVFICLLMAPRAGAAKDPGSAEGYFNRGIARYTSGDLAGAVQDFTRAIEMNSGWRRGRQKSADKFQDPDTVQGRAPGSSRIVIVDKFNAAAHFNRGRVRYDRGDAAGALSDFEIAIRLNPRHAEAYDCRGSAFQAMGDLSSAIESFNKAIQLNPALASAFYNRGNASSERGEYREAIADFTRALELKPGLAIALNNRGNAFKALGEFERAIADYDRALQLQPGLALARANRGLAQLLLGRDSEAASDFQQCYAIQPELALKLSRVIDEIKVHRPGK